MSNRTFTIIKPDSVRKGNFGRIISRLEEKGFKVIGLKKLFLSQRQAENFYAVHSARPFYNDLVQYMTSGPVYADAKSLGRCRLAVDSLWKDARSGGAPYHPGRSAPWFV